MSPGPACCRSSAPHLPPPPLLPLCLLLSSGSLEMATASRLQSSCSCLVPTMSRAAAQTVHQQRRRWAAARTRATREQCSMDKLTQELFDGACMRTELLDDARMLGGDLECSNE